MTDAAAPDAAAAEAGSDGRWTALAAVEMGAREYARTPVLLGLLAFLPAYFIGTFTALVPATSTPLSLPAGGTVTAPMADVYAVFVTPMVGALVGGVAGLFLVQSAREVDARLVVAGAAPRSLVAARLTLLALVAALVAAVATGVAWALVPVAQPALLWAATLAAALTYGLLGVLAGQVLDRLAGVYALLFGSMLDVFVLQNPLADADGAVATYAPGRAPVDLAVQAGFGSALPTDAALAAAAYVLALAVVTAAVLALSLRLD